MRSFIFIFFVLLFFSSCVEQKKVDPYANESTRIINVPEDYTVSVCSENLFSSVKLLPLETKEECLIGRMDRLVICDSLFIINDTRQRILVFDREGAFLRQIGKRGGGPGEYLEVRDFFINNKNELEVLDFKKILRYSLTGEFIGDMRFDYLSDKNLYCNPSYFIASPIAGYYIWGGTTGVRKVEDESCLMYKTDGAMKIEKGYFPIEHGAGANYYKFSKYDNHILIDPTFGDYNIYQIDSLDNLTTRYFFDFGNKSCKQTINFPDKMSVDAKESLDESVVALYNFQETKKWLHLDFVYKENVYSLFYSKANDEVSIIDIKNCQLENKSSFGFWGAIGVEGEVLLNAIEASWIKAELDRLGPAMVEKLNFKKWDSIHESDNPVLVFYELK